MDRTLTQLEKDILKPIADGMTIYDVSEERGVSYNTVTTQLAVMRLKMDCKNTTHLVAECIRKGIIK